MTTTLAPRFAPSISVKEATRRAKILKALADPTRLRMLSILCEHGSIVTVSDLEESIGTLSQPTLSHHLRILTDAGITYCSHQEGTWAYYAVEQAGLEKAQGVIDELTITLLIHGKQARR